MGQMFIKKYPEMAILSSDVLNNGRNLTHDVIITKKLRNSSRRRNVSAVDDEPSKRVQTIDELTLLACTSKAKTEKSRRIFTKGKFIATALRENFGEIR